MKRKPVIKEIPLYPTNFTFYLIASEDKDDELAAMRAIMDDPEFVFQDNTYIACIAQRFYVKEGQEYGKQLLFMLIPFDDFTPETVAHEASHIIDYLAMWTDLDFDVDTRAGHSPVNELRGYMLGYIMNEIYKLGIPFAKGRQEQLAEAYDNDINARIESFLKEYK